MSRDFFPPAAGLLIFFFFACGGTGEGREAHRACNDHAAARWRQRPHRRHSVAAANARRRRAVAVAAADARWRSVTMPTLGGGSDHTDTRWQRPTLGGSDVPAARFQGSNGSPAELGVVEPWLLGCRVLPGRVAGLPGRCRVGAGVPGAGCCRGAAGVLPGAARL